MDFTALIKTVAPWIGTALGGPLGGLAASAAVKALGGSDETAEGLKAALAGATPADMLALKKADIEFQTSMQALGFKQITDIENIAALDRKDARAMQIANKSVVPPLLSVLVTGGFFTLLIGMMTGWLVVSDSQSLLLMLGSLTTGWGVVMAYWFGTTASSSEKTHIIANSTPNK